MNTWDISILQTRKLLFFSFLGEGNWHVASGTLQVPERVLWGSVLPWKLSSFYGFPLQSRSEQVRSAFLTVVLRSVSYLRIYGCWWPLGNFCLLSALKEVSRNVDHLVAPDPKVQRGEGTSWVMQPAGSWVELVLKLVFSSWDLSDNLKVITPWTRIGFSWREKQCSEFPEVWDIQHGEVENNRAFEVHRPGFRSWPCHSDVMGLSARTSAFLFCLFLGVFCF